MKNLTIKVELNFVYHHTVCRFLPSYYRCAGKTAYKVRGRSFSSCTIRLSQPLLTQRPQYDTVNTLLVSIMNICW